jgi:hypothetical protein
VLNHHLGHDPSQYANACFTGAALKASVQEFLALVWRLTRSELQKATKSRSIDYAGWSSLVARRAHNPKVVSSNLTPATNC